MSDDRKYKQRGYQDYDGRGSAPAPGFAPAGKRLPVITAYKETVRCADCGHELTTMFEIRGDSRCPRCNADLHSCRNCKSFDTSVRFECAQPIKERVQKKDRANACAFFAPRTIVVKDLSQTGAAPAPAATRPDEARAALEKLFKK